MRQALIPQTFNLSLYFALCEEIQCQISSHVQDLSTYEYSAQSVHTAIYSFDDDHHQDKHLKHTGHTYTFLDVKPFFPKTAIQKPQAKKTSQLFKLCFRATLLSKLQS